MLHDPRPGWTRWCVPVACALLLLATLIRSRVDPQFSFGTLLIAYLVSFIFWLTIHWIWSQIRTQPAPVS